MTSEQSTSIFDATIPVLDMADYRDPSKRTAFVDGLRQACREVGFFAVLNTQIDARILDNAYSTAETFFRQDVETKCKIRDPNSGGQRGYVMSEAAKGQAEQDFKEFLHVGPELTDEQQARLGYFPNLWPDNMDLKGPLMSLYNALMEYSVPLQEALAAAIDQPSDLFTSRTQEGDTLLRALHYPAQPPASSIWAAAHTDIDLFTILPRATADGLQVQNANDEWIDVRVPDGAIIVNCGDMLTNMTNGEFRSSRHRVVDQGKNEERFSMVLFVHCCWEADVSPLPKCIERTGGVKKFADATEWTLLLERLADLGLASDTMLKQLADSGLMERLIEVDRASPDAVEALVKAGYASDLVKAEFEKAKATV